MYDSGFKILVPYFFPNNETLGNLGPNFLKEIQRFIAQYGATV